jgi:hypothetical protein
MERLSRFVRTTPAAFWLAVFGVLFSLGVLFSGVFGEESEFAIIVMVPGFLLVAVLSAIDVPRLRGIAAVVAGLLALTFAGLVFVFATHPPIIAPMYIHAAGTVIAVAAALSDYRALRRSRPPTPA